MSENIYDKYNINPSSLKRDYLKNPLQHNILVPTGGYKVERPFKEDLEYLYVTKNVELKDILPYFNIKLGVFYKFLNEFEIKKSTQNRRENNIKAMKRLYGVENQFQRPEIIKLCQTDEAKEKAILTKIKNGTFGGRKSKLQHKLYCLLKEQFKEVYEDYKNEKYPFHCDFYIPSIDTYIEYQGYLTHGDGEFHCPFDKNNKSHLKHIKWLETNKPYKWKDIIDTWTIRDPLKIKTAKDNCLNLIEFFNMNDFYIWFKNL